MDALTVTWFLCLVAAVILHEVSHGVVALWFGDDTARRAGRLTLNPVPHIDPVGSLIVPAMGALVGLPVVGWAKPVPVNAARLRNARADLLWVSLAGPGANLLLMGAAALGARLALQADGTPLPAGTVFLDDLPLGARVLFVFALVNLFLGLFNLLPIPPLDGSALLARALPPRQLLAFQRVAPYGILLILVLLLAGGDLVGRLLDPFVERLGTFVLG